MNFSKVHLLPFLNKFRKEFLFLSWQQTFNIVRIKVQLKYLGKCYLDMYLRDEDSCELFSGLENTLPTSPRLRPEI